jgi:hypothetical protein
VLPPAFILLLILNAMFMFMFWWIYDHNTMARAELLNRIVEKCLLRP